MRLVGILLLLAGTLILAVAVLIGLPFSGVYLLGFLGTSGREAGRELLMFLPATLLGCALGIGFIKLGNRLRRA